MTERDDLPEGVIDADPPGGWESAEAADETTEQSNADSIHRPDLTDAGLPPNVPPGEDATADKKAAHPSDATDPGDGAGSAEGEG